MDFDVLKKVNDLLLSKRDSVFPCHYKKNHPIFSFQDNSDDLKDIYLVNTIGNTKPWL